jgi:hypothetical protein
MPMWVNSNMCSGFMPMRLMTPLTATLVEVPISVQVPPRMEAKASGISRRDGGRFKRRARPITGPTNTAVTVVLFMKAEIKPTAAHEYGRKHGRSASQSSCQQAAQGVQHTRITQSRTDHEDRRQHDDHAVAKAGESPVHGENAGQHQHAEHRQRHHVHGDFLRGVGDDDGDQQSDDDPSFHFGRICGAGR